MEETIRRKEEAAQEAAQKRAEKLQRKRKARVARTSTTKRSNSVDPEDGTLLRENKSIESDVEDVKTKGGSEIVSTDFD